MYITTVERMAARPGGFIAKAKRRAQDLNEHQMVGEHEYWGSKGVGGARRSQQRREQTNKKRQSRPIVMQALEKFDYNKSNGLNFQQLTDFLKYLDTREKEQDPTNAELKWVIQMATPEVLSNLQLDSEWVRGEMQLEGEGLETAAMCWRSYTDTSKFIEPVFDEISQSKDAALSKQQLAEVLKRLNEDVEPLEDEVSFVMSKADILGDGVIQRPELMLAISVWYTLHEGLLRVCDLPGQDKKPPPPPHQSKGRVHVSRVSQSSVKAITGYQRSRHRRSSSDSPRNRVDESTLELFRHFDVEFKAGAVRAAKRQEQARRLKNMDAFVKDALAKYDTDGSGGLKFEQLRSFLGDLNDRAGKPPTDDEVKWVIQMCTPERQLFNGEWVRGELQLQGVALYKASSAWRAYTQSVDEIEKYYSEFDPLGTGALDKQALTQLLTKLNDGITPDEEDVHFVLTQADQINDGVLHRPELIQAISIWYSTDGGGKEEAATTTPQEPLAMSACCVMS